MATFHPPSGFRDFLNEQAQSRFSMIRKISETYESFGFSPIETPALENIETLSGQGGGEENDKLIFKVLKRGEKLTNLLEKSPLEESELSDLGLRFDLTLPLSRAVACYRSQIKLPWKVYHIGPVWRAERAQKGRFREFIQCDVDIIGAKGCSAEVEVIQAVTSALSQLGAPSFELRINDRRLIDALATSFGFEGKESASFAVLLDKKDKLSEEDLLQQFEQLKKGSASRLVSLLRGELLLDEVSVLHPEAGESLKRIFGLMKEILPEQKVTFDPSLVRGMGYYTGSVFELRHPSAGYSFGGGGRYDDLVGRFSNQSLPACGLSIGFERLALLLEENQKVKHPLFFPVFDESLRGKVLHLASRLRQAGYATDVYPDQAKIKQQLKFASDRGYPWVFLVGSDEIQKKTVKLRNFISGQEEDVSENDLLERVARLVS